MRPLAYTPLERLAVPRPVDRIAYLREAARGRVVLDLGALDETAWQLKQDDGTWLHRELARVAKEVVGIDSSTMVPEAGMVTGATSRILRLRIDDLGRLPDLRAFDVVVAGELIEHLPDASSFLVSLRGAGFRPGAELLLTTPNATGLHNVVLACMRRESAHRDHLAVYSYKTLSTLCLRAGFSEWRLVPYFVRFTEMRNAQRGLARAGVGIAERLINATEWLFPMLAGGWIVHARL